MPNRYLQYKITSVKKRMDKLFHQIYGNLALQYSNEVINGWSPSLIFTLEAYEYKIATSTLWFVASN